MSGMVRARPNSSVAKPIATLATINVAHAAIAGLLRSTALTLVTTAVMASTSRSQIMGSEKALTAKDNAANS